MQDQRQDDQRTFEQEPGPSVPEGARQRVAIINNAFQWLANIHTYLLQNEAEYNQTDYNSDYVPDNVIQMSDYQTEVQTSNINTPQPVADPNADPNNVIEIAKYRVANALKDANNSQTGEQNPDAIKPEVRQLTVARPADNDLDIVQIGRDILEAQASAPAGTPWFDEDQEDAAA